MWYSKTIDEILKELDVDLAIGLSEDEAAARLENSGPNKLEANRKKTVLQMFLAQLNDALIYVLLAAVAITIDRSKIPIVK